MKLLIIRLIFDRKNGKLFAGWVGELRINPFRFLAKLRKIQRVIAKLLGSRFSIITRKESFDLVSRLQIKIGNWIFESEVGKNWLSGSDGKQNIVRFVFFFGEIMSITSSNNSN